MEEIWKDIVGYEGYYQVSNLGRVKSLDRTINYGKTTKVSIKGKILKLNTTLAGYLGISLYKNSGEQRFSIHKLVAITFELPREDCHTQLDHINNNKLDNSIDNLQWVTGKENSTKRSLDSKSKLSKYSCVYYRKNRDRWISKVTFEGKLKHLGSFKNQEDAYQSVLEFEKEKGIINRFR
jgi:hypothetical protein